MIHFMYTQLLRNVPLGLTTSDPENISSIAKIINEYGSEVVIIAVFILILVAILGAFLNMLNKQNANTIAQNEKFLNAVLEMVKDTKSNQEKKLEEKKEIHMISAGLEGDKVIGQAAKTVIGEIHADRVAAYSFHNGNHTQYGYHFIKMTCIVEKAMPNTKILRGDNHKNMPVSPFYNIIDSLIANDEYTVGNIYSHGIVTASKHIIAFTSGTNVKALYMKLIKDHEGEIAGFVIAEFEKEKDFSSRSFYHEVKESMERFANIVSPIIINDNNKKL